MLRFSGFLRAMAVAAALAPALAQAQPADVLRSDTGATNLDGTARADLPDRIATLQLQQVQFVFDAVLDPERISLVENITEASLSDPVIAARLTEHARSLIRNHMIAMQQVELAIQFLQANRDEILAGNNAQFNQVFGNIGELRDVAITAKNPLYGTAQIGVNLLTGLIQLTYQGNQANSPSVLTQLQPGDFVFVGDAPNNDPTGFVARVVDVVQSVPGGTGGNAGGEFLVVEPVSAPLTTITIRGRQPVYKVLRFEKQADTARYDRVLQTFQAIRSTLQGLDPDLPATFQTASDITYQRSFEDINRVWAPGIAPFTSLDGVVRQELSRTGLNSLRTADRLVRQAGLSGSDSHFHLDRLEDQSNGITLDYQGRQTFPLLWTEDNEIPLQFQNNQPVPGATDEDRAFFRDRQTIFGEPDNPFMQYLARAFFEETINHAAEFFDDAVAVEPGTLDQLTRPSRRPARGALFDLNGNGVLLDPELTRVPESGDDIEEDTEFRRWQMIIESFAEHSTDLSALNVAGVGIGEMFGAFVPDEFRANDAGNFARFAGLIGGTSDIGGIDVTRIEPFGKRGSAGFNPVVPRN